MNEIGTPKELQAQAGDVLSCVQWAGDMFHPGQQVTILKGDPIVGTDCGLWRIVSRAKPAETGPVRTVTRREIVPGSYGHIWVDRTDLDMVMLGMRNNALKKLPSVGLSAGELRAMIATLTEIADALEDQ